MSTIKLREGLYARLHINEAGKVVGFDFRTDVGGKAFVGPKLRKSFAKAIAKVNGPPEGDPGTWYETQLQKSKEFREALGQYKGAKEARTVPGTRMLDI